MRCYDDAGHISEALMRAQPFGQMTTAGATTTEYEVMRTPLDAIFRWPVRLLMMDACARGCAAPTSPSPPPPPATRYASPPFAAD